jgi:tRNA threonylcarbamoyladenosine biosynthesis protein TsaB
MKLLAFDTSTDVMSIAVQHGTQVLTHTGAGGAQASTTLIPAIRALMAQAGLAFAQLDAIAFGRGPGSFTGLRTACSVAQGLAFAAHVKVLPIDTLMALAHEAWLVSGQPQQATTVCAALDARMGEVYCNYYTINSNKPHEIMRGQLEKPAHMVLHQGFANTLLAGNIRPTYDTQLPAAVLAAPYLACLPSARAMLHLAPALIAAGGLVNAQDALPLYIRDKVAQTTAEREGSAFVKIEREGPVP